MTVSAKVGVRRLGHLVLRVRDIERSEQFYTEVLGLKVMGKRPGRMVFFSSPEATLSHELACMAVGPDAPGPEQDRVGLYHMAWQVDSVEELEQFDLHLKEHQATIVGYGDHGVSVGIYFLDPDGNEIECYYELPPDQWNPDGPHTREKFPQPVSFLGSVP
jgi:catechol-2,3-dioxygenase